MGERKDAAINLKTAIALGRVSNLPTVCTNVLAGVILAGGGLPLGWVLALMASISFFYTGGMFLNDAFDHQFDKEHRPERPIPAGLASVRDVYFFGFGQLLFALALLAMMPGNPGRPLLAGGALALSIIYYNAHHKNNGFAPVVMGLTRALVYITAAVVVSHEISPRVLFGAGVLLCYIVGLTYAAKQENVTKIQNLWPFLFLAAPFVYGLPVLLRFQGGAIIYALFALWTIFALGFLFVKRMYNVPRAVMFLLAGICLLDGVLIAMTGNLPLAILAACCTIPTLLLQKVVSGT